MIASIHKEARYRNGYRSHCTQGCELIYPLQMLAVYNTTIHDIQEGRFRDGRERGPGHQKYLLFMGDDDGLPVKYSMVQRPMSWSRGDMETNTT